METRQSLQYGVRVMGYLTKFDPDQPRDASGRWGGGAFLPTPGMVRPSGERPAPPPKAPAKPAAARPRFVQTPPPPRPEAKPLDIKVSRHVADALAMNRRISAVGASAESLRKPGRVVELKPLGDISVGVVSRVKFENGAVASHKTDEENNLRDRDGGESFRATVQVPPPASARELTAYELSEAAGFGIVPPTARGDFGKGEGVVQAWVDGETLAGLKREVADVAGYENIALADDYVLNHPDFQKMAALDYVFGNTDRHGGNYLIGRDGRIYAIDHNLAFPVVKKGEELTPEFKSDPLARLADSRKGVSREVFAGIEKLTPEVIRQTMKRNGFDERHIKGAVARRDKFLDVGLDGWVGVQYAVVLEAEL
jgi:hypothetical protein